MRAFSTGGSRAGQFTLPAGVGLGGLHGEGAEYALDSRLCRLLDSWCLVLGADVACIIMHEGAADPGLVIAMACAQGNDGHDLLASRCGGSVRATSPGDRLEVLPMGRPEDSRAEDDPGTLLALDYELLTPLRLAQSAYRGDIPGGPEDLDSLILQAASASYHWIAIGLSREGSRLMTLAVASSERRRIQLVKSRLRLHLEAVTLVAEMWQRNRSSDQLAGGLATTVETLADGVILSSARDRALYVNEAARRLTGIRTGDPLLSYPRAGGLDQASWLQLMGLVQRTVRQSVSIAAGGQPLPMLLQREGRRPLVAAVRSLDLSAADERQLAEGDLAVALVFLIDPDSAADDEMLMICQLHGLTPTEARLAVQLAKGLTLAEAADLMRIKQQTARAYLKQIFDKFSVHRQADLIRLLLRSMVNCRLSGRSPAPQR